MNITFVGLILLQLGIFGVIAYHQDDYTLVYERTEAVQNDERYINVKTRTFKYNRTQAVTNFTAEFKVDFGNDLKMIFQGYRFASNEYRLFPIVFDRNACKSIKENEFGIQNMYNCGQMFTCPMKKGNYTACKWFPDGAQLPPYIPSGRYKIEIKQDFLSKEIAVIEIYFAVKRRFDRK